MSRLTPEEIEECREIFQQYKKEDRDVVDLWDVKTVMSELDHNPTEEELFQMLTTVDADDGLDFQGLIRIVAIQKNKMATQAEDSDTVDAFVAMGGNPDKSGEIQADMLRKTIKEFGLTIDIDQLILETDTDGSGFIDYEEFQAMLDDER